MRANDWTLAVDTYNIGKLFHGNWDLAVLALLRDGPRRPRDLARMAADWPFRDRWNGTKATLNPSRITEALRVLTEVGLVYKTTISEGWDRSVEYGLTEAGVDLLPVLESMQAWLRRHVELFENADGSPRHRRAGKTRSAVPRRAST